jgi:hypothetical protein
MDLWGMLGVTPRAGLLGAAGGLALAVAMAFRTIARRRRAAAPSFRLDHR